MFFWNLKIGRHITSLQQILHGLGVKTRALGLVREPPYRRICLKCITGRWKSEVGVENVEPKNATLLQSDPIYNEHKYEAGITKGISGKV